MKSRHPGYLAWQPLISIPYEKDITPIKTAPTPMPYDSPDCLKTPSSEIQLELPVGNVTPVKKQLFVPTTSTPETLPVVQVDVIEQILELNEGARTTLDQHVPEVQQQIPVRDLF